MSTVHVIIPHYQRAPGILRRAVCSVLAQDYGGEIIAHIVDDSSPLPAADDVAGLDPVANRRIDIVHQANGGPGAARNRGLDESDPTAVTAFLDSDDWWDTDRISRAVAALDRGFDLYVSDWVHLDGHRGFDIRKLDRGALAEERGELAGDLIDYFFDQIPVIPSSLVFRGERLHAHRYDADLRNAGEDHLYFTRLAVDRPRVFVHHDVDVRVGDGLNIYQSVPWNSLIADDQLANVETFVRRAITIAAAWPPLIDRGRAKLERVLDGRLRVLGHLAIRGNVRAAARLVLLLATRPAAWRAFARLAGNRVSGRSPGGHELGEPAN